MRSMTDEGRRDVAELFQLPRQYPSDQHPLRPRQIARAERDQAGKIQAGQTLREQTAFGEYLARRAAEPSYTFRRHLRQIGGAIEE